MKQTPEKILADRAQQGQDTRLDLLRRGIVRIDSTTEAPVNDAAIRLLQIQTDYLRSDD